MNKCEHGEKITIFCASDCCVWKQAGGCDLCIKKYHNHMGPTIFLTQEQIITLVKRYTMDSSIKPKCRLLQQTIYSYFNQIKTEITNSIDTVCKNIINQIGYPYLYSNNTLSTYKRLKNKEYKKLLQKQFKTLYEMSLKLNDKDLLKEQSKIYIEEMKNTEVLLNGLEDIVKRYQAIIKNSYPAFVHDNSYFSKINQILKTLSLQSPLKASKSKELKQKPVVKPEMTVSLVKQKQQPKLKTLQLKKATSDNAGARTPIISVNPPVVMKPNYSRDVSIDRKMVKQHKFANVANLKPSKEKQKQEKQSSLKEVKSPNTDKIQTLKQQLNNKELEINEKKRMLIDMMKQKQESLKKSSSQLEKKQPQLKPKPSVEILSYFKRQISQRSASKQIPKPQPQIYQQFNLKTTNDQLGSNSNSNNDDIEAEQNVTKIEQNNEDSESHNHAFTQLPYVESQIKKSSQIEQVKQKVFFIPKTKEIQSISTNYAQVDSPIFKNFNKSTVFNKPKEATTNEKRAEQRQQEYAKRKAVIFSKQSQVLELKENEQKSLALLLKSLALNAEQAIKYLQSALNYAQNNLSAAQYLSYIYLEQDKPQNCLHLCNKMLQKLQNSPEFQQKSLIMNNNKAAALNILGRYSESIMILQKCLRYRQKDYFYKNLGDAYFSISIYEKAIYNYEKTLKINEYYDQAQYNLAVCLYIQQNYYNAKLAIKKALEMQPQNDSYLQLLQNIEIKIKNC